MAAPVSCLLVAVLLSASCKATTSSDQTCTEAASLPLTPASAQHHTACRTRAGAGSRSGGRRSRKVIGSHGQENDKGEQGTHLPGKRKNPVRTGTERNNPVSLVLGWNQDAPRLRGGTMKGK
ncbi:hypothetical protein MDA_GLEAN10025789 [Myotis davidii]|uniref:Secreted protein n=1 Tax=Myotis davidii TaxID=225400 RepID=L5LXP3_MYODS|nr:hypothetical protein MDA_GLEAN10025789 [Myotis davidii]